MALRGMIHTPNDYQLYMIDLGIGEIQDILLRLSPECGDFWIYANQSTYPTNESYQMSAGPGNGYELRFTFDGRHRTRYFVRVEPAFHDDFGHGLNHSFFINYYVNNHHLTLIENTPLHGIVQKGFQYQYYKYDLVYMPAKINFILTSISGNADIVISYHEDKLFPTIDANDGMSNTTGQDMVSIVPANIKLLHATKTIVVGVFSHD